MARILRVLVVIVGLALVLGPGLVGCGPRKSAGPTDLEQEKKFIEKGQGMKPGAGKAKTEQKAKAAEEENKDK